MRKVLHLIAIIGISIVLFGACKKDDLINDNTNNPTQNNDSIPDSSDTTTYLLHHTEWTYNKNIYEVNVRQYTPEGTFEAFEDHLPRLKKMGVDILWFMPIHPIGEENRLETLGSYYSVKDYKDVNPEFGSKNDFIDLVEAIHKKGMYVIMDWVPNHTSWDNALTITNKDYYLLTADGNFQAPPGTNWSDVIQLDYSNEALQNYMIETLKHWIKVAKVDGFRFDYVDGIPKAFWEKCTQELKTFKPDVFLIAESDGVKYHNMGFDMDYSWGIHGWGSGLARKIYEGTKSVADLNAFLVTERTRYMPSKYHMYFTSNHDENSWEGTVFEQLGESAEVFAALTQTLYGMPLVYSGQEAGLNKRLKFFSKDEIDWSDLVYEDFYKTFNLLRDTCPALWMGDKGGEPYRINTSSDDRIFAFVREKETSRVLVFLNLSDSFAEFSINDSIYTGNYSDVFSNKTVEIDQNQTYSLTKWNYLVLTK